MYGHPYHAVIANIKPYREDIMKQNHVSSCWTKIWNKRIRHCYSLQVIVPLTLPISIVRRQKIKTEKYVWPTSARLKSMLSCTLWTEDSITKYEFVLNKTKSPRNSLEIVCFLISNSIVSSIVGYNNRFGHEVIKLFS